MANPVDNVRVAESARFVGSAQIARIDETNKLGRLVIENYGRVGRIGRTAPELRIIGHHMRFIQSETTFGITAMAVGAAEHHAWRSVHGVGICRLVALNATRTLAISFFLGLINPVAFDSGARWRRRDLAGS